MEAKYKLTYYNLKGIAEPIRFIFRYVGVPFEDDRLDFTNWPAIKEHYPWGVLPVLEVDGKQLSQSFAIGRYLGKIFKLTGKNDFEAAKCDEYGDALKDVLIELRKLIVEHEEAKKKIIKDSLRQEMLPKYLGKFEKDLVESGKSVLVGDELTWIDFFLAHYITFIEEAVDPDVMQHYPKLDCYKKNLLSIPQIKEWLLERPQTKI